MNQSVSATEVQYASSEVGTAFLYITWKTSMRYKCYTPNADTTCHTPRDSNQHIKTYLHKAVGIGSQSREGYGLSYTR
jgi:hypothetical protein